MPRSKEYPLERPEGRALELLWQAVANGLASATVLTDPSFAEVRRLPGFGDVAAALERPRRRPL